MNLQLFIALSLATVAVLAVNPNERTDAGQQSATASKSGDSAKIVSSQRGSSKTGSFTGDAQGGNTKTAKTAQGHKAVVFSSSSLQAGDSRDPDKYTVKKSGDTYTAGSGSETANLDYSNVRKDAEYKPVVKTSEGKGISTDLNVQDRSKYVATAKDIQNSNNNWKIELPGGKNPQSAVVYNKGSQVADVQNIQTKERIQINQKIGNKVPASSIASSQKRNGKIVNEWNRKQANLKEDASYTEIKDGFRSNSAYIPRGQKKVYLKGPLLRGPAASAEYTDATEEDCPYNYYSKRRLPHEKNRPWKYREPEFKIYWDEMKVDAGYDKTSGSISANWPQCVKVKVPMKFPHGTKLENLAVGMSIYFPGCPRFTCAGRVCGLEVSAQAGLGVGEPCFTDDVCKLKPVSSRKQKSDIVGYVAGNAETNICNQGYNGGNKLWVENTFCQTGDDREKGYKPCPLINFSPDESSLDKKIVVIGRIYEKKQSSCRGLGCLVGRLTSGVCNIIQQYNLVGCRELGMNYRISAFGLNGDDIKFTGIKRQGGSSKGGVSGGSGGGGGGGVRPPVVDPVRPTRPTPATRATPATRPVPWWLRRRTTAGGSDTQTTTTPRPWWQRGFWNGK